MTMRVLLITEKISINSIENETYIFIHTCEMRERGRAGGRDE